MGFLLIWEMYKFGGCMLGSYELVCCVNGVVVNMGVVNWEGCTNDVVLKIGLL